MFASCQPPLGSAINKGHPLGQGLVGCWLCNEFGGSKVHDYCSFNTGNFITKNATRTPWQQGGSMTFDGTGGYLLIGNIPQISNAPQMTISGWARRAATDSYGGLFYANPGHDDTQWIEFVWNAAPTMYFLTQGVVGGYSSFDIPAGLDWKHYVAVFDGTQAVANNRHAAYVNGSKVTLGYGGTIRTTTATITNAMAIGTDLWNSKYFNGDIASVMVWNRALSAQDVALLYAFPYCMFGDDTQVGNIFNKSSKKSLFFKTI